MTSPRPWIWVAWLILIGLSVLQISSTRVVTDASSFLPGPADATQRLMIDQLRDGLSTRILVIGLHLGTGASNDKAQAKAPDKVTPDAAQTQALVLASRALRKQLAGDPRFAWVSNGDLDDLTVERDRVFAARYLLSQASTEAQFSVPGLAQSFAELERTLVSAEGGFFRSIAAADPTLAVRALLEKAAQRAAPSTGDGVWIGMDGRVALMLAETATRGDDIEAMAATIAFARSAALSVLEQWPAGLSRPTVEFAGAGYFNVQSHEAIGKDALLLSLAAIALVSAILIWALRSPRFLLLAVIPVASGSLAGYAVVGYTYGTIHGITLAFGITLIGEAVDYAIYTFVQADEQGRHSSRFWRQVFLAMLTSLIGFTSMYFSGFAGLQQLGLFSITGLLVASGCARLLLPRLLPLGPSRARTLAASWQRFAWLPALVQRARRMRMPILLVSVVMLVFLGVRYPQLWQDNLDNLSSSSAQDNLRDQHYRDSIGVPDMRTLITVRGSSLEQALVRTEATTRFLDTLVAEGVIRNYESPADLLPSKAVQAQRRAALPSEEVLRARLIEATGGSSFRPQAFEPFVQAVGATLALPDIDLRYYENTMLGTWLRSQIVTDSSGVNVILMTSGARSNLEIRRRLQAAQLPGAGLIDLKADVEVLVAGYREQAQRAFVIGALGIFAVLAIQLRRARAVFSMITTIVTSIVITAGVLLLVKGHLTLFNLVSLLLVMGVASNYSLFFSTLSTQADERQRASVSVLLAAVSTFVGFAILAFSSTPVLAMIGTTVAIGAAVGLGTSMAFSADAQD